MDGETRPGAANAPVGAHRRWLFVVLGWIFFVLGMVGAVLPLVPTTPFMLLALWAFSIGSERFHRWLYHHRIFGPPLQRWQRDHVIPLWTKALSIGSMSASFLYLWLARGSPWFVLLPAGVVVIAGVAYVARFPSRARASPTRASPT